MRRTPYVHLYCFSHYLLDRPVVCNQRCYVVVQDVCCTMHLTANTYTLPALLKTIYDTKMNCMRYVSYWRDGCTNYKESYCYWNRLLHTIACILHHQTSLSGAYSRYDAVHTPDSTVQTCCRAKLKA